VCVFTTQEDRVRGVYIAGLRKVVVGSAKMLNDLMAQGAMVRTQAATNMNERSSRSHSIFTIVLQQRDAEDEDHNVFASVSPACVCVCGSLSPQFS
jgi:hypothetical protein